MMIKGLCFNEGQSDEILFTDQEEFSTNHPLIFSTTHLNSQHIFHVKKEDFLPLQKKLADFYYPHDLKFIGITGTNGKTSTAFLAHLMVPQSYYLGTLGLYYEGEFLTKTNYTSPPYLLWRKLMQGRKGYCFIEVSSHALDQERFYGVSFERIAWTNFSQDHLDYHKSLEHYFQTKKKILNYCQYPLFVSEKDLHEKFPSSYLVPLAKNIPSFFQNTFQEKNFSLAYALVESLNLEAKIENIRPIPGRCEQINIEFEGKKLRIIIDYAHTPDGLEKLLQSLPKIDYLIFGCGGDRDRGKRPLMGQIAQKYASQIIITEDNSRSEDPYNIYQEINLNVPFIKERKEAILKVFQEAQELDLIVIAGKGEETYLDRGHEKIPHKDKDYVLSLGTLCF